MIKKSTVVLASGLVWLRWFIASLSGYIHPDEFFQNPEITSSLIFGIQAFTPWEYQPQNAARSIVAPFLTTGIPFWILKNILPEGQLPSATQLYITERLGAFVWSLFIDLCVYRLCKQTGASKPLIPMLLVATSQITLAYYTHTFSNSFESVLLCLCLSTVVDYTKSSSNKLSFALGALFSLGVFTRITFPLFALPIGIAFIVHVYKSRNIHHLVSLTLGFFSLTVFCITADSVYYGTLFLTSNDKPFRDAHQFISTLFNPMALASFKAEGSIVITPVNNLLYNMNAKNLQLHGIHPRYTHLAINLPLLFGPLAIQSLLEIPSVLKKATVDTSKHFLYILIGIVFTSLVGLSIIPHQEARFLCPLLIPLVLIYTWRRPNLSLSFWLSWFLFNIITTYVFGVIHQGGIVPAMRFLHYQTKGIHNCYVLTNGGLSCSVDGSTDVDNYYNITTKLVFYKTYMPPQHLLAAPLVEGNHHIRVLDFSSRYDDLVKELEQSSGVILRRRKMGAIDFAKTSTKNAYERTLFITPSFINLPIIPHHRYMLLATFSPHVGFDDMDKMISRAQETNSAETQMNLNVFLMLSDKDDTS
ncbi:uncharacterized protein RHIMIDRAFT_266485 [Rhizopus microsporus ATCC 52813]|uniref:Mannosyltransferase n=2 Tax=Rhizopus microsporus TaxID=58291 RepID=A0A2G4T6G1_RHIZD|nr:uncharacterized protein RHIMIDRAFT_266485 [Rhizopus microsporus ATCC 52813]PHZ16603.1 hypothetical protein RHIMIDRAFT_266485 [Rhizopus microsporus ATCC 52813]